MESTRKEIETKLGIGVGRRRRWIWWGLALVVALTVGGWSLLQRGSAIGPIYVTAPAARSNLVVTVTATGSVEPTNMVDISSELSGTLVEVLADYNDVVTDGQLLARLDTSKLEAQAAVQSANLRAAEARVAKALANFNEAQINLEITRNLDERGVASHQSLTTAEAAFSRASADLEVANADVSLAGASLDLAKTELTKACICSPINGVVLDRKADVGQIVAASLSAPVLFTVAEDLTKMELQVAVDEADIGRIATGNRATFTVDAYDERLFPAQISQIRFAPQTIEGVVTYMATLSLENADLSLRPGMTATADIVVREVANALLVPNAALRFAPPITEATTEADDDRSGLLGMLMPRRPEGGTAPRSTRTVWVLRDGIAVELDVEPGDTDGRFTEIRGGELSEGDSVIVRQEN